MAGCSLAAIRAIVPRTFSPSLGLFVFTCLFSLRLASFGAFTSASLECPLAIQSHPHPTHLISSLRGILSRPVRRFPALWTVEKIAGGFKVIDAKPMLIRRNPRRRPAHPGAALRDLVLPPLGMSKTRLARLLGLSRYQLSQILAEKMAVTPAIAEKLKFVIGGSAQEWSDMQAAYDGWRS